MLFLSHSPKWAREVGIKYLKDGEPTAHLSRPALNSTQGPGPSKHHQTWEHTRRPEAPKVHRVPRHTQKRISDVIPCEE